MFRNQMYRTPQKIESLAGQIADSNTFDGENSDGFFRLLMKIQ